MSKEPDSIQSDSDDYSRFSTHLIRLYLYHPFVYLAYACSRDNKDVVVPSGLRTKASIRLNVDSQVHIRIGTRQRLSARHGLCQIDRNDQGGFEVGPTWLRSSSGCRSGLKFVCLCARVSVWGDTSSGFVTKKHKKCLLYC